MKSISLQIISNDGVIHNVWKYINNPEGEEHVWCKTWHGHHIIGIDCKWYKIYEND